MVLKRGIWVRKQEKEYYLMHKDIPVCLMEISDDGALGSVRRNEAAVAHFPLGGQMNNMKFHEYPNSEVKRVI